MSSYVNIYLKSKKSKEPELLVSYSRSCPLYEALDDNLSIPYCGEEDTKKEFTADDFGSVIDAVRQQYSTTEKRVNELEKHASGNLDIINEILSFKEYLAELNSTIEQLCFLQDIARECTYSYAGFESVMLNIG